MTIFIKAMTGASLVVLISIISQTKNYFLAGLIPLFPIFALIAHFAVGQRGPSELKNTALFGMLAMIPYFAYLLSVYYFSNKLPLYLNLLLGVAVWTVFAIAIYLFWIKMKIYIG